MDSGSHLLSADCRRDLTFAVPHARTPNGWTHGYRGGRRYIGTDLPRNIPVQAPRPLSTFRCGHRCNRLLGRSVRCLFVDVGFGGPPGDAPWFGASSLGGVFELTCSAPFGCRVYTVHTIISQEHRPTASLAVQRQLDIRLTLGSRRFSGSGQFAAWTAATTPSGDRKASGSKYAADNGHCGFRCETELYALYALCVFADGRRQDLPGERLVL